MAPGFKVGRKVGKSRNIETRNGGAHSGLRLIRVEVQMGATYIHIHSNRLNAKSVVEVSCALCCTYVRVDTSTVPWYVPTRTH